MESTLRFGRTIRIYLADGTPTGIRHAELVNWTLQVVVCPRSRVSELGQWPEAQRPGVYILLGEKEGEAMAYIGESENVQARLGHHVSGKDFWQQAVFVTSKDDNLTKAHVKYIESKFQELAIGAKRTHLERGRSSELPSLPRPDRAAMDEYIESARVLLSALGFQLLEPLLQNTTRRASSPASDTAAVDPAGDVLRFTVKKTGVEAEGRVTDEGFVVFAGARGVKPGPDTLSDGWRILREQLIQRGAVEVTDVGVIFKEDVLFSSPSAASAILSGTVRNGRVDWKDASGRSLKELEAALARTVEEPSDAELSS